MISNISKFSFKFSFFKFRFKKIFSFNLPTTTPSLFDEIGEENKNFNNNNNEQKELEEKEEEIL